MHAPSYKDYFYTSSSSRRRNRGLVGYDAAEVTQPELQCPGLPTPESRHFRAAFHGTRPLGWDSPPTSQLAKDMGLVTVIDRCRGRGMGEGVFRRGNVRKPPKLYPICKPAAPHLKAFRKSTHLSPVPFALLEIRKQYFSSPACPCWGLFWYLPGPPASEGVRSLSFH